MKKVTLLSLVLILLAVSVVPVMAAGSNNGHGNGNGTGQGNSAGDQDQTKQQEKDQEKVREQVKINYPGLGGNGNQEHMRMRTPFYLQGTITAIDTAVKTLTVNLIHGNAQVKQYLGTDLTLQASETTMIFKITRGDESEGTADQAPTTGTNDDETPSNRVPITFDQLVIGQKVAIHGNLVEGVYTARLVTVYIQMNLGQPVNEKP